MFDILVQNGNPVLYAPPGVFAIFDEFAAIPPYLDTIFYDAVPQVFCNRADIFLDGDPTMSLHSPFELVVRPARLRAGLI
jgi:hypothetical protein